MTKELIERITQAREHTQLYGQVLPALWVYQPFTMNAGELFSAIEALQARVAELEKVSQDDRACCVSLQKALLSEEAENDALAVELAALKNQEPVATLWRENNQKLYPGLLIDLTATGEALPTGVLHHLFAAPTTPVREPLSYRDILRIYNEVGPEDGVPYRFAGAIEAITKEQA